MANHKSAKKRARQTIKRTARNKSRKAALRTASKKVETATDKKTATTALKTADKLVQRAAKRGILHKNTAARRQSKLARTANKAGK
ncbi:MAG: 30S ribosomal protein S20 [Bdellovibrionales bacterium]